MHLYVAAYFLWLTALIVAAWFCGRSPERCATLMLGLASLVTVLVRSGATAKYHNVEIGVAAVDLALLAGFSAIAFRHDGWWPTCITAFQAITLAGHLAKMIDPAISRMAYALMITLPSYPLLAILTLGVARRLRQLAGAISRN